MYTPNLKKVARHIILLYVMCMTFSCMHLLLHVHCRYSNLKINTVSVVVVCSLRVYLQAYLLVNMPKIYSKLQSVLLLKLFWWFWFEQLVSSGAFDVHCWSKWIPCELLPGMPIILFSDNASFLLMTILEVTLLCLCRWYILCVHVAVVPRVLSHH